MSQEITPTALEFEELSTQILEKTYGYIKRLDEELEFCASELDNLKKQIAVAKNVKTKAQLLDSYQKLLGAYNRNHSALAISYMASYRPLLNLLRHREDRAKVIEAEEEVIALAPTDEIELTDEYLKTVYKPYED
ncbi:MAG: hypothetical protein KME29_12250 [Calothrix sp. FI2-JRJ7]|jgi:recombinational DNA repair protein RecR|nr:hypothetical protein [Calothrix sp. FI2-JRJ7]